MRKIFIWLAIVILFIPTLAMSATDIAKFLSGRILLQVQAHGEAWYVNPVNLQRYYLGKPDDAYSLMRKLGLGITNVDLNKIAIANQKSPLTIDKKLSQKMSGRILLQVQAHGEAWYVNPDNLQRYYLGGPTDAFFVMRSLGIGVTTINLEQIIAATPAWQPLPLEKNIFALINAERQRTGLSPLVWNDNVAAVAREHSQNLATENEQYTGIGYSCDYPLIHHEGTVFGLYSSDRLNNRGVYYFSKSGENIALIPAAHFKAEFTVNDPAANEMEKCQKQVNSLNATFENTITAASSTTMKLQILQDEQVSRRQLWQQAKPISIISISWLNADSLAQTAVNGWMNSPGHRRNILDPDFSETGVGIASVNGYMIATQVFIKRVVCGWQTGPCCEKIGYYPYCFVPLKCTNNVCK
jgi:hypothetical protein